MSLFVVDSWVFSTAGETCKLCQACRRQIESFLIEQIITPHSPARMFFTLVWLVQCETFQEEKFCEWTKCFSFIAVSLWFGGQEWQNPNKSCRQSRKRAEGLWVFFSFRRCVSLELKYLPQSYMQVEEKATHFLSLRPTPLYSAQLFPVSIQIKKIIVFLLTLLENSPH